VCVGGGGGLPFHGYMALRVYLCVRALRSPF